MRVYCCNCGTAIPEDACFCQRCGSRVIADGLGSADQAIVRAQQTALQALLKTSRKPNECHSCGRKDHLYAWDFGLAKPIASKTLWAKTAASVAVSAITLPLIGIGALELPGKRSTLNVLRLRLLLCDACKQSGRQTSYAIHPWWDGAHELGYTQFLSANDLTKLRWIR